MKKKSKVVTTDDLQQFGKEMESRLMRKTRAIVKESTKEIIDHIDSVIEIKKSDLIGVSHDEIRLMQDKQEIHEERITTLEQKVGLAP